MAPWRMDSNNYNQAIELFEELVDLSRTAQATRLQQLSAKDPALHALVASMLENDQQSFDLLDVPQGGAVLLAEQIADPPPPPDRARPAVGQRFGDYQLNYRLGAGGTAEVWSATHQVLGVDVALKLLFEADAPMQTRLLREGRVQSGMNHPNILPVRDIIDVNGVPGLVLPLIRGPALDKLLRQYHPTEAEAIALFTAIVEGVEHAHQRDLVHRDLKPGNVLLERRLGRIVPRISDFGLVKSSTASVHTQTGVMMGTLSYAAPEQLYDASSVDARADLFSLGVMLVELLTGKLPFPTGSLLEILNARRQPPDLSSAPRAIRPLCQALLEADPAQRLQNCSQLLAGIRDLYPRSGRDPLAEDGGLARAVGVPARSAPPTAEPSAPTPPHNLPVFVDAFVGRQAELKQLAVHLTASRLVNVLGAAGIGKTRLTLHFARHRLRTYPGGVWFIDLSDAKTLAHVETTTANVLGLTVGSHGPRLGRAIAGRSRCLIILDNFEQIIEAARQTIGVWLQQAPEAHFVVTSRALLNLPGEQIMALAPLKPDLAVELFVTRAREKIGTFSIDEHNREDVVRLVDLLDNLPLAIELAAARIRMMKPATIVSRMNERFRLLSAGPRGTRSRQSTLRAAIDWSWTPLTDWEKATFAQCSVFEDSFTLEAAEAVIDLSAFPDAPWPMDAVQSLMDKSLLRSLRTPTSNEQRFGMLKSIHDYANEKFAAQTPAVISACQQRHAEYFADHILRMFGDGLQKPWWMFANEVNNLAAAVEYAAAVGRPKLAQRAALAVTQIVIGRGPYALAERVLQTATRALSAETDADLLASILHHQGLLSKEKGEPHAALAFHQQALAMYRDLHDQYGEGAALVSAAELHEGFGRLEVAETQLSQAKDLAQRLGDDALEELVLVSLAAMYERQSRLSPALEHYTQAIQIARRTANCRTEALAHNGIALLYANHDQLTLAATHYTQALRLARKVGDRIGEGIILGNMALLSSKRGQFAPAVEQYAKAIDLFREMNNLNGEAFAVSNLAHVHARQGRFTLAREEFRRALDIYQRIGKYGAQAHMLRNLGRMDAQQGQLQRAEARFTQALTISETVHDRANLGILHHSMGNLWFVQGHFEKAEAAFITALDIFREIQMQSMTGMTLVALSRMYQHQGHTERALSCAEEGLAAYQTSGEDINLSVIHLALAEIRLAQSEHDRAQQYLDTALQHANHAIHRGVIFGTMGELAGQQGRMAEGRAAFERGEAVLRDMDSPVELGTLLCQRARLEHLDQADDVARIALTEAESIAKWLALGARAPLNTSIEGIKTLLNLV